MTAPDPRLNEIQARLAEVAKLQNSRAEHSGLDAAVYRSQSDVAFLLAELRKAHEALASVEEFASRLDAAASDYEPLYAKGKVSARASAYQLRAAVAAAKGDERG